MAIKFKTKPVEKPVEDLFVISETGGLQDTIDAIGEINEAIEKLSKKMVPLVEELGKLEATVFQRVEDMKLGAEQVYEVDGQKYRGKIGKKAMKSEIVDKEKLVELLELVKSGLYLELSKVTMTDLGKYLTGAQLEQVVKKEATGSRKLKVVKLVS